MTKNHQDPGHRHMVITSERHGFVPKTIPLLLESPKKALDIDTEWDWVVADAACAAGGAHFPVLSGAVRINGGPCIGPGVA